MKDNLDIDKLFKDTFESFEPAVDAKVWQGIASSLGSASAASAGASAVTGWVKGIVIGAVATGVGIGTWFYVNDDVSINASQTASITNTQKLNNNANKVDSEKIVTEEDIATEHELEADYGESEAEINETRKPTNIAKESLIIDNVKAEKITINQKEAVTNNSVLKGNDKQAVKTTNTVKKANSQVTTNNKKAATGESNNLAQNNVDDLLQAQPVKANIEEKQADETADYVETPIEQEKEEYQTAAFSEIPNVFTPNNDRKNDFFFIESENMDEFYIVIYTKDNRKVYESTDANFKWDGFNMSGNKTPVGDYYYLIKAVGVDGQTFSIPGQVSIR